MSSVLANDRLTAAVDVARDALIADGQRPGRHLVSTVEGECAVAHYFAADVPGYQGWQWCVVVAGVPDSDDVTVSEVALLPSNGALLAPSWVPWIERIQSGDMSPGDLLAAPADDPRLVPNQIDTGDEFRFESEQVDPDDIASVAGELGLGRKRVLSASGRADAAQRWFDGPFGPSSEMALAARYHCASCGFYAPLAGSLRAAFGACTNEFAADGRIVSAEYGCGAHSDVVGPSGEGSPAFEAYDDGVVEIVADAASGVS
nr:DUF3027 domain-containing protein [Gordonia effusa]